MMNSVYTFLGILGLDVFPTTIGELIPYFFTVTVGLSVLWCIFSMFRYWVGQIVGGRII